MPAPTLGRGTTLNTTPRRRKVSLKRSSRSTSRHLTIALASECSLPLTIRQTAVLPGLRATAKNRVEIDYDVERWSEMSEKDYILGTHDEELLRLGLQHRVWRPVVLRSEEHTSELQSPYDLVCRLLLEKKNRVDHHRVDEAHHPDGDDLTLCGRVVAEPLDPVVTEY